MVRATQHVNLTLLPMFPIWQTAHTCMRRGIASGQTVARLPTREVLRRARRGMVQRRRVRRESEEKMASKQTALERRMR